MGEEWQNSCWTNADVDAEQESERGWEKIGQMIILGGEKETMEKTSSEYTNEEDIPHTHNAIKGKYNI